MLFLVWIAIRIVHVDRGINQMGRIKLPFLLYPAGSVAAVAHEVIVLIRCEESLSLPIGKVTNENGDRRQGLDFSQHVGIDKDIVTKAFLADNVEGILFLGENRALVDEVHTGPL